MNKLILVLCLLLTGCDFEFPENKPSELKQEGAEIIQLSYLPSQSYSGTGIGMSMSGSMVVTANGGSTEEKWGVVIRCDQHHKTFALDSKSIYQNVKAGDKVILDYYEERYYPKPKTEPNTFDVRDYHTVKITFNNGTIVNIK